MEFHTLMAKTTCLEWCGYCYENLRRRANHKHHRWYRTPKRIVTGEDEMSMIKRSPKPGTTKGEPGAPSDGWLEFYAGLQEFLTMTAWEDGAVRQTGTLMLLAEGGLWKLWIHDRDGKRSVWISGQSVEAVTQKAEDIVQGGPADWRPDKR